MIGVFFEAHLESHHVGPYDFPEFPVDGLKRTMSAIASVDG
jgi:hypothetical protein